MARYIDAEALTDYMLERYDDLCEEHGDYDHYTTGYGDAIDAIENAPTADVVPKSEVEDLIRENESLAKTVNEASELIRKLRSKVKKSKSEVAREIFEEIEKLHLHITNEFDLRRYNELRKKYTEEKK